MGKLELLKLPKQRHRCNCGSTNTIKNRVMLHNRWEIKCEDCKLEWNILDRDRVDPRKGNKE